MHALAAGLLFVLALAPEAAPRSAPGRVALLRIQGDERLQARLSAELRAQRFEVVEVEPAAAAPPERELEDALRATGAGAAIRVGPTGGAIQVWVANGVTGKQIFRQVAPEEGGRLDRAIVAMWTVELLRASAFIPRVEVVAAAAPPPAPQPAGVAVEVAPVVALSPGGLGPSWHVMIGARWRAWSHGGVEGAFFAPVSPLRLERTDGVAVVSLSLFGAGLYAATGGPASRWSLQGAAGASLLLTRATGDTTDLYLGHSERAVSGGPYLRAGVSLRASGWFHVRADALGGFALPRPVVQFDQTVVASWGRPWTALLAGGEASF